MQSFIWRFIETMKRIIFVFLTVKNQNKQNIRVGDRGSRSRFGPRFGDRGRGRDRSQGWRPGIRSTGSTLRFTFGSIGSSRVRFLESILKNLILIKPIPMDLKNPNRSQKNSNGSQKIPTELKKSQRISKIPTDLSSWFLGIRFHLGSSSLDSILQSSKIWFL